MVRRTAGQAARKLTGGKERGEKSTRQRPRGATGSAPRGTYPKDLPNESEVSGISPRDLAIYQSWIRGSTQQQLADVRGLSRPRISQICTRVSRVLAQKLAGEIEELRAEHTSRLMHIYEAAMAAWRASREDAVTTTTVRRTDQQGNLVEEIKTTTRSQSGDSSLLHQAMTALADIRAIWGADKIVTDRGFGAPEVVEVIVSSREQAKQMMAFDEVVDGKMFVRPAN